MLATQSPNRSDNILWSATSRKELRARAEAHQGEYRGELNDSANNRNGGAISVQPITRPCRPRKTDCGDPERRAARPFRASDSRRGKSPLRRFAWNVEQDRVVEPPYLARIDAGQHDMPPAGSFEGSAGSNSAMVAAGPSPGMMPNNRAEQAADEAPEHL